MNSSFHDVISATVRQAKAANHLLWADRVANRIADATPLAVNRCEIAEELTLAAIQEGVPVHIGPSRQAGACAAAAC